MRQIPWGLSLIGWATLGYLYIPLLAVAVCSFNDSRLIGDWQGFTWQWYERLFVTYPDNRVDSSALFTATRNTLTLGIISTIISTVLGTLLAFSLRGRWPRQLKAPIMTVVLLPVVTPDIILAAAMVALRQVWSLWDPGMLAMIAGHVTFQVSFVTLVVSARLAQIGHQQAEAARDLYASSWDVFYRVLLPQAAPAIAAGAMLAFTLSLDDFVISFFTAGPESTTLPLLIQASIRRGIAPELHALSTLILLATVVLVLSVTHLTKPRSTE
jgi:spermidine/putrescine transport system permease protein